MPEYMFYTINPTTVYLLSNQISSQVLIKLPRKNAYATAAAPQQSKRRQAKSAAAVQSSARTVLPSPDIDNADYQKL